MQEQERPPVKAWVLLGIGLLAVSSAGAVFRTMEGVDPLLKAAWRLQATALILLPGFIIQWRSAEQDAKTEWKQKKSQLWLLASGVFLWLHFGTWVWSLDHTSLTHSLLFVTAHPLVVVCLMVLRKEALHRWEVWGAILGFSGAAIALQDARGGGEVTMIGDLMAFAGAVTVVGYLMLGRHFRSSGMPLHLYVFPVTAVAAILLTLSTIIMEGTPIGIVPAPPSSFGWIDAAWLLPVAYLALGPGYAGHTGINACLKWLPTILISVTLVMEPLIGALLGWMMGVEDIPGKWTWIGGPVMIAGTALVASVTARKGIVGAEDVVGGE